MHRASDCGSHRVHGDVHARPPCRLFMIKSDEYNAAADVIVAHAPVGRLTDGLAPSVCGVFLDVQNLLASAVDTAE